MKNIQDLFHDLFKPIEFKGKGMTSAIEYPRIFPWVRGVLDVQTVIDLGAHNGEFVKFLGSFFHPKKIYAFEPLQDCVTELRALSGTIRGLQVFDCALSDRSGETVLYRNAYAPASSLLRVGEVSKKEFPKTQVESSLAVRTAVLDELLDADELPQDIFIKIDVQGVEDKVIRGGRKVFGRAKAVLVEMSFVPMYDDQPLFEEVHALLSGLGLRFKGIKNQIHSPATGQPLFCHCMYVRPQA